MVPPDLPFSQEGGVIARWAHPLELAHLVSDNVQSQLRSRADGKKPTLGRLSPSQVGQKPFSTPAESKSPTPHCWDSSRAEGLPM